jgi:hypothetical protein
MQIIDFGFGMLFPIVAHALVHTLLFSAFIGLPCPKKMAGIGFVMFNPPREVAHRELTLELESISAD